MGDLGIVLVVIGILGALVSGLMLCARGEEGDEDSGWWLADAFILGGLISFVRGVARGISGVFHGRGTGDLVLVVVFFVSVVLVVVGSGMD